MQSKAFTPTCRTICLLIFLTVSLFIPLTAMPAAADNNKEAQSLVQKGDDLLKQGKYKPAEKVYAKAWEIKPSLKSFLHQKLGMAYTKEKRWVEAASEFNKAAEIDKENVVIRFNLANVYSAMGLPEKSIKEYHKILSINPELFWAEFNLSSMYRKSGNYEKAIKHCKNALELNENVAPVHFQLGDLYERIHMFDKAAQEYKTTISLDPKHVKAHFNLGNMYLKKREIEKALAHFEKSKNLDPGFVKPYVNIGTIKM